jgi:low affinity Fe/Cu permease
MGMIKHTEPRNRGQRWADAVTEFSGSWPFIAWFVVICVVWIGINLVDSWKFDPYPFLFLNWVLTVVSTFQNPLIMLSQNRQNEMDQSKTEDIIARLDRLENPECKEHKWVQAGETGKIAIEYDKHYWCTRCGTLRHDTGWAPVTSTYHKPKRDS